jgi:glycerol-3-phosphate acyltransferase PlsY
MILYILLPIVSYLIASIPFGLIISKLFYGIDIRTVGSGNIGATNVTRNCGKFAGISTFLLDFLKGIAILIPAVYFTQATHNLQLLICSAAILGHSFSIYLKFKGGKSVAISFACFLMLYPPLAISFMIFWLGVVAIFRKVGLSSVVTCVTIIISALQIVIITRTLPDATFLLLTAVLIIAKHLPNIREIKEKLK